MRLMPYHQKSSDGWNKLFDDDFLFGLPVLPFTEERDARSFYPAMDVVEEKDGYILKIDLPGCNKEDIKVSVENGILTMAGERKTETELKEKHIQLMERTYGCFVRSLNLGVGIDQGKIRAQYKDGVLELMIPKSEAAKTKAVDIQVA